MFMMFLKHELNILRVHVKGSFAIAMFYPFKNSKKCYLKRCKFSLSSLAFMK